MDEEEMEDVVVYYEREIYWRIVIDENKTGINEERALIHAKSWYVYMRKKNH